jgi:YD repeat-containing protein
MLLFFFRFAAAFLRTLSSTVGFKVAHNNDLAKRVTRMGLCPGRGNLTAQTVSAKSLVQNNRFLLATLPLVSFLVLQPGQLAHAQQTAVVPQKLYLNNYDAWYPTFAAAADAAIARSCAPNNNGYHSNCRNFVDSERYDPITLYYWVRDFIYTDTHDPSVGDLPDVVAGPIGWECPYFGISGLPNTWGPFCLSINAASPPKNAGSCSNGNGAAFVGNPIHAGIANKYQHDTDYEAPGPMPLVFGRYYNSLPNNISVSRAINIGLQWKHTYDRAIFVASNATTSTATITRADGKAFYFTLTNDIWVPDSDVPDRLVRLTDASNNTTGWRYTTAENQVELYDASGKLLSITNRAGFTQTLTYNPNGRLMSVTDSFGRQLAFGYDTANRIATMTDASGRIYQYAYDPNNNLGSVTYPDGKARSYVYNEPAYTANTNLPHALTGIVDENGSRFATYQYDNAGRAISSEHAGGAEKVALAYNADGTTTVWDYKDSASSANVSRIYSFQTILGVVKNTAVSQPCATCGGSSAAATTYDLNGNVASKTDFNGNKTAYIYDLTRNLETQRIEGLTSAGTSTPQTRTITTEWHPSFRLVTRLAEPKRLTSYAYNGDGGFTCGATGAMCSKTITETTDTNGSLGFAATPTDRAHHYQHPHLALHLQQLRPSAHRRRSAHRRDRHDDLHLRRTGQRGDDH